MPLPLNRNPFLCRAGFIKKNENQRCYLWQILHRNPFLCRAGFIPKDLSELERMKKFIAIPFYVGQVSSCARQTGTNKACENRNPFLCRAGFILQPDRPKQKIKEVCDRNPFLCRAGFIQRWKSKWITKKQIAIPFYVGQVSSPVCCLCSIKTRGQIAIPFYVGQVSSYSMQGKEILEQTRDRNPFLCRAGFIWESKWDFERQLSCYRIAIPFYVGQVSSRGERVSELLKNKSQSLFM